MDSRETPESPPSSRKGPGFKPAFQLLCLEGAFAMAYETWVGPVYLSGLAGEIGVGVGWVAWLTAAPWIGQVGQVLGTRWVERASSVKGYTLRLAWSARLLWLVPLICAAAFSVIASAQGTRFPTEAWFAITIGVACLSSWIACSSAVAWNSWMKSLIPAGFRGRFFGARQRASMAAVLAANGLAAILVGIGARTSHLGYALLGGAALLSGAISSGLLSKVPAPPADRLPRHESCRRSLREIYSEPMRDRRFLRFLAGAAAFHFAILVAGPYFPYYYTRDLGIPMSTVSVWIMLSSASCCVSAPFFGRWFDRLPDPRRLLRGCAVFMALSPLPYLFPSPETIRMIAPFEHLLNGAVSSGYTLGMLGLLFAVSPKERNWTHFSFYSAALGVAGAAGALLGGWLAEALAGAGGFRALWVVAAIARVAVVLILFPRLLPAPTVARAGSA